MGEMVNMAGMGPKKITKSMLEYNRCVQKVTEINSDLAPLTLEQAKALERGQVPEGIGFQRVLAYVFLRLARPMTRMLQETWWQKVEVAILTSP